MTRTHTTSRGTVLREGVTIQLRDEGIVELAADDAPFLRVRGVSEPVRRRLEALDAGVPVEPTDQLDAADERSLTKILDAIGQCLGEALWQDGTLLLRAESLRAWLPLRVEPLADATPVRLGKFAYLRRRQDHVVAESPLAGTRVEIHHPGLATLLAGGAAADTVAEFVATGINGMTSGTVRGAIEILTAAGIFEKGRPSSAEGGTGSVRFPSDEPVERMWDFHDLLFHTRSRIGRTDEPFGGVFPYVGELEPLPAVRPHHEGSTVELPRPDLADVESRDPLLVTAMEARTSVRQYGTEPMRLDQLAEFLYRTARVRSTYGPLPDNGMPYPASSRPYPCGGAGYELEVYLTVQRCAGLEPGCYHYESDTHRLVRLEVGDQHREMLLATASTSAGGNVTPDVLVTITARFQRIAWKYRSIAYAVTLKHTGVLYQTMYLVATAMGLGGCGLGSGNSDLVAEAFRLDYTRETGVGEFLLGSLPDGTTAAQAGPAAHPSWAPVEGADWQPRSLARLSAAERG